MVLFATLLLFFIIYSTFSKRGDQFNFAYLISFAGILNCLIVLFTYMVVANQDRYDGLGLTSDFLVNNPSITYLVRRNGKESGDI